MRILFICPYFGKLPDYFEVWLKSCASNPKMNWLIITDDHTSYQYPSNVEVRYQTFEETKSLIKSKFDFEVSLDSPYKLCDYKPAYGYLFEQFTECYDFWGHCDMDCVFGDLAHFLNDDLLERYDKLLCLGHMTIYRNTYEVNRRFMKSVPHRAGYQEVYSNGQNYTFDEWSKWGSINDIYDYYKWSYYREEIYADLNCLKYHFTINHYDNVKGCYEVIDRPQIFAWEQGKVYCYYIDQGEVKKEEYAYVHFQKRRMTWLKADLLGKDDFWIVPNAFIKASGKPTEAMIRKYSKHKLFYDVYFKQRYKNLITKLKAIRS